MTYNTGDDMVIETVGITLIATTLISEPRYLEMVGLPFLTTAILTFFTGMVILFISRGRIFWAVMSGIAWILLKLGIVHKEESVDTTEEQKEEKQ